MDLRDEEHEKGIRTWIPLVGKNSEYTAVQQRALGILNPF